MFKLSEGGKPAEFSFFESIKLYARISLGWTGPIREETDKIDKYGYSPYVLDKTNRSKVVEASSESDFIQTLMNGNASSVQAIVNIPRQKSVGDSEVGLFNHRIRFLSVLSTGEEIEFNAELGKHPGNADSPSRPVNDRAALMTYITAGKALVSLKERIPTITTIFSASNLIYDADLAANFNKEYYYRMLQSAHKYHIQPWK